VLTGAGTRAFCAGASLDDKPRRQSDDGQGFREAGRALIKRIETHSRPVIAAIRGWAIGGGFAIAQACDVRIAAESAKFRTGDAYIGIVPSWGMSLVRLVHYIGRNRTLDMLMLGEDITARAAQELGLLTRVVADERLDAEVAAAAARIASGAPLVFRAILEGGKGGLELDECRGRHRVERRAIDDDRGDGALVADADRFLHRFSTPRPLVANGRAID